MPQPIMTDVLLAHGGVGSDQTLNSFLDDVVKSSLDRDPLKSVVNSVVRMEDDPRFNAGTGSYMRLDGSIQMDASVMIPGSFGAVIAIEKVRNPVLVAVDVMNRSPHVILSGDGATRFARILGHAEYNPETEKARIALQQTMAKLKDSSNKEDRILNFRDRLTIESFLTVDTVGAVARISGKFAGAVSTGGANPMLRGRVGDVSIPGAGIYVGSEGAVVATGIGEDIIRNSLCFRTYERISDSSLVDVLREEISHFNSPVGLIAVNGKESAWFANRQMSVGYYAGEHVN